MCGNKFLCQWLWHFLAKICTKNYENPSIFIKVTAKKSVAPFSGHGVYRIVKRHNAISRHAIKNNKQCDRRFGRHGMPPPASNDTVFRIKKRQRWDVQTMWACDVDLWPWNNCPIQHATAATWAARLARRPNVSSVCGARRYRYRSIS